MNHLNTMIRENKVEIIVWFMNSRPYKIIKYVHIAGQKHDKWMYTVNHYRIFDWLFRYSIINNYNTICNFKKWHVSGPILKVL